VGAQRLALSCEIKVAPQQGKSKKKGGNAAMDKKQSQFERAKQAKNKKERRHAAPRKNAVAPTDPEAEAKKSERRDEDKLRRRPRA
jgi:hypothetical protein